MGRAFPGTAPAFLLLAPLRLEIASSGPDWPYPCLPPPVPVPVLDQGRALLRQASCSLCAQPVHVFEAASPVVGGQEVTLSSIYSSEVVGAGQLVVQVDGRGLRLRTWAPVGGVGFAVWAVNPPAAPQ